MTETTAPTPRPDRRVQRSRQAILDATRQLPRAGMLVTSWARVNVIPLTISGAVG